ncbi:MAG: amino acid permease [Flavobacteriaceae bacterium]|jgi:APA family basic amino acid/polyamine antiporter|nr:amino acid permease [Flavobacteriaceae bacterium]
MLFSKKTVDSLVQEVHEKHGETGLKRSLSSLALVSLGVGAVIGAGLFSITGMAAANYAGPAIIISFVIAAVGCAFAGLCYAEFASMIPIAGSAYTYSYATMGEFIAWIIGWDLVLEYSVGAATVASSWSGYLNKFLSNFNVSLPLELLMTPFDTATLADGTIIHGIVNLPAVFIIAIISLVLIKGTSGSSRLNNIIVILKVSIVIAFVIAGFKFIRPENFTPFIPENKGEFGAFGWSGIIRAAGVIFFAYVGFDAVSTVAQETKNPKRSMPIGIMGSLFVCTVLYVIFAYVMIGVAKYTEFGAGSGADHLAPVATAIAHMGYPDANGVIQPAYPWLNQTIIIAILLGYTSVIMVMLLGQSRVFYSMSHDGLLPKVFSQLHSKFHTPAKSNLFFMVFVSLFAAFVPGRVVGEMMSIGTLFAFILVCAGIIVMRKSTPDAPRAFRTPLVPLIPILGILTCLGMMAFLPLDTWIRLVAWMMVGFSIYLSYGIKKSHLSARDTWKHRSQSYFITSIIGLLLCVLLGILTLTHHYLSEEADISLIVFAIALTIFHLIYFGSYLKKSLNIKKQNI